MSFCFINTYGNAMRMRLVYLTCTLLWLVMSALIGMSFINRSILSADQDFDVFGQQLLGHIGQKLQANEVVLSSYAAYRNLAGARWAGHVFETRLMAENPQIRRLFYFDDLSKTANREKLLRKGDVAGGDLSSAAIALLRELQSDVRHRQGQVTMRSLSLDPAHPSYLLVRATDDRGRHFVGMEVSGAALLPSFEHRNLPAGGDLSIWQGAQGNDWMLERHTAPRTGLEDLLFPRFESVHQMGGSSQPLMVRLSWQLGFDEMDPVEMGVAVFLSLAMLTVFGLGLRSYARYREGSLEREMRLFYLANHDRLTNLANRNLFYDRLQHAITRLNRSERKLALLFLDMDRFKPVNDTYGHTTGDRVLQMIAARLKQELRIQDTVARLGGDEFAVLIEDVETRKEVDMVIARLKSAIEVPYDLDGHHIRLGVSIGVAYYPEDGMLIEELLSVADRNMYGEKSEPVMVV
jgi:diguanylate cyclase